MSTRRNYFPPSPGSMPELAKHYYNTQLRDTLHPSQRFNRASNASPLDEPVDILGYRRATIRSRKYSSGLINKSGYEGALEDELERSEGRIDRMEEGEQPRPRIHEMEVPDELELIEKRVWGDLSKPIHQLHRSGQQEISGRGKSVEQAFPEGGRIWGHIGILNHLPQGLKGLINKFQPRQFLCIVALWISVVFWTGYQCERKVAAVNAVLVVCLLVFCYRYAKFEVRVGIGR